MRQNTIMVTSKSYKINKKYKLFVKKTKSMIYKRKKRSKNQSSDAQIYVNRHLSSIYSVFIYRKYFDFVVYIWAVKKHSNAQVSQKYPNRGNSYVKLIYYHFSDINIYH